MSRPLRKRETQHQREQRVRSRLAEVRAIADDIMEKLEPGPSTANALMTAVHACLDASARPIEGLSDEERFEHALRKRLGAMQ